MKEKIKSLLYKISDFILSIPAVYIIIPFMIIAFLIDPLFGFLALLAGYLIPILGDIDNLTMKNIIVYYAILTFFSVTLPGDRKVTYKNVRDVNITSFEDKFYAKYKDKNKYKIESYNSIPVCKNYQIVDEIVNYNYFGYQYKLTFNNSLKCKNKKDK